MELSMSCSQPSFYVVSCAKIVGFRRDAQFGLRVIEPRLTSFPLISPVDLTRLLAPVLLESHQHAFSFNGEPQAEAKLGYDACGLPLNEINTPPARQ